MDNLNASKPSLVLEEDRELEKPLDPAIEKIRKKLMRLMLCTLVFTAVLILAVFAAVVYKIMKTNPSNEKPLTPLIATDDQKASLDKPFRTILLDKGSRLLSQSVGSGVLSLEVLTLSGKHELLLFDLSTWQRTTIVLEEATE